MITIILCASKLSCLEMFVCEKKAKRCWAIRASSSVSVLPTHGKCLRATNGEKHRLFRVTTGVQKSTGILGTPPREREAEKQGNPSQGMGTEAFPGSGGHPLCSRTNSQPSTMKTKGGKECWGGGALGWKC